jgi:hypothetical protein
MPNLLNVLLAILSLLCISPEVVASPGASTLPGPPNAYPIIVDNYDVQDYISCTVTYSKNYLLSGQPHTDFISLPSVPVQKQSRAVVGTFDSTNPPGSTYSNMSVSCY